MQATIITLATPVFFVLIFIELAASIVMKQNIYRVDDAINSIGLGVLSQISAVFSRVLTIGIYTFIYSLIHVNGGEQDFLPGQAQSGFGIWIFALVFYDFCYYWLHRMGHEYSILWAAHVVHHQSEEYNLSTALRQTATGTLLGWVFYIPMAIVGIHPTVMAGVAMIDLLYQFWIHTQLVHRLGWFDRVFASPSNHRVHHAVNEKYLDKNYGGIFIIWDRIFGTYVEEDVAERIVYGTRAPLRSWNPLWANFEVYSAMLTDMIHTGSWSNRWKILVSKTGWRPADVSESAPTPAFNIDRPKFQPSVSNSIKVYVLIQFSILLGAAIHFLQIKNLTGQHVTAQNEAGNWQQILYGCWIMLSLTSLGTFMEGKPGGVRNEIARHVMTGVAVIWTGQWFATGRLSFSLTYFLSLIAVFSIGWVAFLNKDKLINLG